MQYILTAEPIHLLVVGHDVAQELLVVIQEPTHHNLAVKVDRSGDVTVVTAWIYAPRQ